jgi:hypothetical protein
MKKYLLSTLVCGSICAFDGSPWVIEPLKPDVKALYSYGFFSKVHGYGSHFVNNQLLFSMDVAFPNHFQFSVELDQDASTFNNFYFRDAAVEIKKQITDDVAEGDNFSAAFAVRGIAQTAQGRLDPATLYPGGYHIEGIVSVGKEWSFDMDHYLRTWAVAGMGIATHSSLWTDFDGYILYRNRAHELKILAEAELGYGASRTVNIYDFQGWGHTRYRYLDLGFTYGYEIGSDLFFKLGFSKRALSKVMPRNYNYFTAILEKTF